MKRTRDEFVRLWRTHLAGLALYGAVGDRNDGPLSRAGKVFEIPSQVESLLGKMYDDLKPAAAEPPKPSEQPKAVKPEPPKNAAKF